MNPGNDFGNDFYNHLFTSDYGQGTNFMNNYDNNNYANNNYSDGNNYYGESSSNYDGESSNNYYDNDTTYRYGESGYGTGNGDDGDDSGYEKSQTIPKQEESSEGRVGNDVDYSDYFVFETGFNSFEEAFDRSDEVAYTLGFHLVKVKYKPEHYPPYNIVKCERHGTFKSRAKDPANPQRKSSTKRFECPFELRMINMRKDYWEVKPRCGTHNHHFGSYLEGHRRRAKLEEEQKSFLKGLWESQMKPGKVRLAFTRNYPDQPAPVIKQIYNENAKFSAESREGRNSIQQMFKLSGEANYFRDHLKEEGTNVLTDVFMAHPEAVKMFKAWPYVVLIDSTYLTNKFDLILVECVGVTPVGNSFLIAYALIRKENDTCYEWVLRNLKSLLGENVSPNVIVTDHEGGLIKALPNVFGESAHFLCLWHIYNAVETYATNMVNGIFGKAVAHKNWKLVVEAPSWEECQYQWAEFKKKYKGYPRLLKYLEETWWNKHIGKFAKCFTNLVMHFGNTATSRVESAHAVLKMWFGSAKLSLDTVWKKTDCMLVGQHIEIRRALENSISKTIVSNTYHGKIFSMLNGRVSAKAILAMQIEFVEGTKMGNDLWENCRHTMVSSHGVLCACKLHQILEEGRMIHLNMIHKFWCTLIYTDSSHCRTSQSDMLEEMFDEIRKAPLAMQSHLMEEMYTKLHPEDEVVEEPKVAETRRGRPRKSNTRNKSAVEHARRRNPIPSNTTSTDDSGYGPPLDVNWDRIFDIKFSYLFKYIPEPNIDYFEGIFDPEGDGHCGFRVMSHAKFGHQKSWSRMRLAAVTQLKDKIFEAYCFGEVNKHCQRLAWAKQTGCPPDHWMENWDLFTFATVFNWVVCCVCISYDKYDNPESATWVNSNTYLPVKAAPGIREPSGILWIGHTGNHWFRLRMRSDCPMPPVNSMWHKYHDSSVDHYEEIFTERLMHWRHYVESSILPNNRRRHTATSGNGSFIVI